MPRNSPGSGRALALALAGALTCGCLAAGRPRREPGAGIPVDTGPDYRGEYKKVIGVCMIFEEENGKEEEDAEEECRRKLGCTSVMTKAECGKHIRRR